MDYHKLQVEHREWLKARYPSQTPDFPALGCVEEAGELVHCILKASQANVWGTEPRYRDVHWGEKLLDAVGDCAIYAVSLSNANGWEFEDLLAFARTVADVECDPDPVFKEAADLVACATAIVEQPTNIDRAELYLAQLLVVARACGVNFDRAVEVTWAQVSRRTSWRDPVPITS